MPLPSTLTLARETLNELPADGLPPEIIHLDMYSTGVPIKSPDFDEFYDRLLHLLAFIDDQASRGRRILFHCSDGYTETSLMALSWIMYKEKLTLPEAYLFLQEKRSFFVYAIDLAALRQIELRLQNRTTMDLGAQRELKRKRENTTESERHLISQDGKSAVDMLTVGATAADDTNADDDEMDEGDHEMDEREPVKNKRLLYNDEYINAVSNQSHDKPIPGKPIQDLDLCELIPEDFDALKTVLPPHLFMQCLLEPTDTDRAKYPWFYSQRFEGSFPSRILPFLYLGNLNHATNPDMLKVLRITHVVSVGEHADLDQSQFNHLFLDNLYDDGIDSIHGRLEDAVKFIGMLWEIKWRMTAC